MPIKTGYHLDKKEIAQRYAKVHHRSLGREFNNIVIGFSGDLTGKVILDAGCGYGELLEEIHSRYSCELYGVDFSQNRLSEIQERTKGKISTRVADLEERFPFENDFFDFVFCLETLEHLKSPGRCLSEIKRVAKKRNGEIILSLPNATGYFPFNVIGQIFPLRLLHHRLLPYEHPLNTDQPIDTSYTYHEILDLLSRNQLAIMRKTGYKYFRYLDLFPFMRDFYHVIYPGVVWLMSKTNGYRFAYHLILACRPVGEP